AGIVLEVEQARAVRVGGMELLPHLGDRGAQLAGVALRSQDLFADRFESLADARVAGAVARARERLVLPHPRALLLVAREGLDRGDEEPGGAARPEREVGLEQHSRGSARAEPGIEALRIARIDLGRLLVRVLVEKDDVQVRGIAELLAAELAVADDGERRRIA